MLRSTFPLTWSDQTFQVLPQAVEVLEVAEEVKHKSSTWACASKILFGFLPVTGRAGIHISLVSMSVMSPSIPIRLPMGSKELPNACSGNPLPELCVAFRVRVVLVQVLIARIISQVSSRTLIMCR